MQLARRETKRRRLNAVRGRMLPVRPRVSLARWTVNATPRGMGLAQGTVNAARHGFDAVPRRFDPGWRTLNLIAGRFRAFEPRNPAIG